MDLTDLNSFPTDEKIEINADESYRMYLINQLIIATEFSRQCYLEISMGRSDFDVLAQYTSILIHLYMHLDSKIKSVEELNTLQSEWETFRPWVYNPTIPIFEADERIRLPDLFLLIRTAFEKLGLTDFRMK